MLLAQRRAAASPRSRNRGHARFTDEAAALVIGRLNRETVLSFGGWAYGSMPVVVLSRSLNALSADVPDTGTLRREEPSASASTEHRRGQPA